LLCRKLQDLRAGKKIRKEDSYIIRGTVINNATHAAIGRALVYSTDNRFAKMTDDQGHFEFTVPLRESEQTTAVRASRWKPGFSSFSGVSQGVTTTLPSSLWRESPGTCQLKMASQGRKWNWALLRKSYLPDGPKRSSLPRQLADK